MITKILKSTTLFKLYTKFRIKQIISRLFTHESHAFTRSCMDSNPSKNGENARLVAMYHVIEKGLTMPDRRLGFGQPMVLSIINKMSELKNLFGCKAKTNEYLHSVAVLTEYYQLHKQNNFKLEPQVLSKLETMITEEGIQASSQLSSTAESYWRFISADFEKFSNSRHSVRHYGKQPISIDNIKAAIKLANNAPSACNRQPCRVYCISNKEKCSEILRLQGGNRGFGHLADKVLILTSDRSLFMYKEPFAAYVNGGIYLMNLSYSLHFHKIAHCILAWNPEPFKEKLLRNMLPIKESEAIICALSCGSLPDDEFLLASSPRKNDSQTFIEI